MIKTALVIIGGKRIGDTAHLIPFFESIKDRRITWVTGTYEKEMAYLIQSIYPNFAEVRLIEDATPQDMTSCNNFRLNVQINHPYALAGYFDEVYNDFCQGFDLNPTWKLKDTYFSNKRYEGGYIVYHLDSISGWKTENQIRELVSPLPCFSIGRKGDFVLPGSTDFTGKPLPEVVNLIAGCSLFVGIHSAMACLTFYINKPAVVVHFTDSLLKFGEYRRNFTDLIRPDLETLIETIKSKLWQHN